MTKPTLSKLSDLAQVVSALAVIVSLIYVGREIKANTEASRAATRQAIAETDFQFISTVLDPLTLLEAESKLAHGQELSLAEHFALVERQHLNFRIFENAYFQFSTGLLETETWNRYRRIIQLLFTGNDPAQAMWEQKKQIFDASFREEVEAIRTHSSPQQSPE
jgi:hypothetical protein